MPYLIHLDRRDSINPPVDHPETIRAAADGEEVSWNSRTRAMEVAATVSLVLHPSSSRLSIGMWHERAAAGVLYAVSFG